MWIDGDWWQFGLCMLLIGYAGAALTRSAQTLADETGLSSSWIGLLLLAAVTSLPELAAGMSAVTVAAAPDIAVGDALGSTVFNLALLVMLDMLHRPDSIYTRASSEHVLSAAYGVLLLSVIGAGLLLERQRLLPAVGPVGAYTPLMIALYLLAMRSLFRHGRLSTSDGGPGPPRDSATPRLRAVVRRVVIASIVVAAAGIWLPFVGVRIADDMGWSRTFVGTLLVAAATSMPEVVVAVAAWRLGALDMAIAGLLGSNLFDVLVIGLDDLAFQEGPLLARAAPVHAVTVLTAMAMSAVVIVGLVVRPQRRWRGVPVAVSLALLAMYLFNVHVLRVDGW